jgi:Envelope integrity protein A
LRKGSLWCCAQLGSARPQHLRQLGDVGGDAPGLVLGEPFVDRAAVRLVVIVIKRQSAEPPEILADKRGTEIGFDYGADGAHTMMLVYNLPQAGAIFDRFLGVAGSAYFVGGLGMTTLTSADGHMVVVPIRSGLGLRLGANLGYLKFTERTTWNPF